MEKPSMLNLVLRKIQSEKPSGDKEPTETKEPENPELEQAMNDFSNATTATERAAAFKAALELAK